MNAQNMGRASLDGMITPRDPGFIIARPVEETDAAGYSTYRSSGNSIQLTGIKPKALIFESPTKSPQT